ncbi:MAG: 30S ribosomal protein S12 methylthiotransferase RimO [bacterium]
MAYLTLGCDKNRVDTEYTLGRLYERGFRPVPAPGSAFALIINTCGFIDLAKEESVETILEALEARQEGTYEVIAVVGCLVERYRDELCEELPEVDLWMGLEHTDRLAHGLSELYRDKAGKPDADDVSAPEEHPPSLVCFNNVSRLITTRGHYSFLKIADGCSGGCSFCAIPRIKGPLRSRPLEELVSEARALEAAGIKELNLVAQDTTAYGKDLPEDLELADLLERILSDTGIPWIRVLYAHPEHVTDRLIELLAQEPRLLRYLDLPLQHISDRILSAMGRNAGRREIESLLDRLHARVPGLVLRSTFLVGFPGETDKDFRVVIDFIEEGHFFWAAAFGFSPEEGTAAYKMKGGVDQSIADERAAAVYEAQRGITARKLGGFVGGDLVVLVDEPWSPVIYEEDHVSEAPENTEWLARFRGQAVEVDGVVKLMGRASPGSFVRARVTGSWDYDLDASLIEED